MRVCLVSGEFPPMQGGVGDFTQELGAALVDQGHEVLILTSTQAPGPAIQRGCQVFPALPTWSWSIWGNIREYVARLRPDVVNVQYQAAAYGMHPAINLLPWRACLWRIGSPRFVVTFHDLLVPFLFRGAGPLRRLSISALAAGCVGAITTNEEDASELKRRLPRLPQQLIPIGSNIFPSLPADYDRLSWRSRWKIQPHQLALSYFGFLNQSKGGEELIQMLGRLVGAGIDAVLVMVGGKVGSSDPSNRAYLEKVASTIDSLGLVDRVVWTDYLSGEEVSATLKATDICVLPYRDGVSTRRGTLMAALAHGMPVVTTTPRVASDHFRDGQTMMLVPARDPDALAGAVRRLVTDAMLRERLSQGAAELSKAFSWPSIAAATADFFAELVGQNTCP